MMFGSSSAIVFGSTLTAGGATSRTSETTWCSNGTLLSKTEVGSSSASVVINFVIFPPAAVAIAEVENQLCRKFDNFTRSEALGECSANSPTVEVVVTRLCIESSSVTGDGAKTEITNVNLFVCENGADGCLAISFARTPSEVGKCPCSPFVNTGSVVGNIGRMLLVIIRCPMFHTAMKCRKSAETIARHCLSVIQAPHAFTRFAYHRMNVVRVESMFFGPRLWRCAFISSVMR